MPTPLSAVSVCNLALSRIGVLQKITSLADQTPAGVACNAAYDFCRQELIQAFPWGWASSYAQLALVATQPNAEWLYAYQYPTEALFIRRIMPTPNATQTLPAGTTPWPTWNRSDTDAYPAPYEIGYLHGAQVIYTDLINATCKYTFDQGDTTPFTAQFADLFAWRLAMELAYPLANSDERRRFAEAKFDKLKWEAPARAMNEQQNSQPFVTENSEFIRGRWNG